MVKNLEELEEIRDYYTLEDLEEDFDLVTIEDLFNRIKKDMKEYLTLIDISNYTEKELEKAALKALRDMIIHPTYDDIIKYWCQDQFEEWERIEK